MILAAAGFWFLVTTYHISKIEITPQVSRFGPYDTLQACEKALAEQEAGMVKMRRLIPIVVTKCAWAESGTPVPPEVDR